MSASQEPLAAGVFHSALFGVVAPTLGWTPPVRYLLRRERVLKLARGLPRGRLVEVGCGAGALLHDFCRLGFEGMGLETSDRARDVARAVSDTVDGPLVVAGVPGRDWEGQLDLVCAFDVLEHIEDDDEALAEWVSWLRPGGRLLVSVPAHRARWGAGDEWAGHFRRYDRVDLEAVLRGRGLHIEHLECYGFPLANLTEWAGQPTYRRLVAERSGASSKAEATAESGIERRDAGRLFRLANTLPGRAALKLAFAAQAVTAETDWGSGYLAQARKP